MGKGPYGGFIVVKGGDGRKNEDRRSYKQFYHPTIDKGSSKPAFCYPSRQRDLEEEVASMERALEMGNVGSDRRLVFEAEMNKKKQRLEGIKQAHEDAVKKMEPDKDEWVARRKELAAEIRNATPSKKDVKERRVNPHTVIRNEKEGLGEVKKEYQVISRLLGEESNVGFLQRD